MANAEGAQEIMLLKEFRFKEKNLRLMNSNIFPFIESKRVFRTIWRMIIKNPIK